jgi:hypothetical protein
LKITDKNGIHRSMRANIVTPFQRDNKIDVEMQVWKFHRSAAEVFFRTDVVSVSARLYCGFSTGDGSRKFSLEICMVDYKGPRISN